MRRYQSEFRLIYGPAALMRWAEDRDNGKTEQQHLVDVVWDHRLDSQRNADKRRLSAYHVIQQCHKAGIIV